jgi:predicted DNA-binding WGR domain protein
MNKYFEFKDGKSSKFWEISITGKKIITRFGKIGTTGQTSEKSLADAAAAQKEYDRLIREKTQKGYVKVGKAAGGKEKLSPKRAKPAAKSITAKNKPVLKKNAKETEEEDDESFTEDDFQEMIAEIKALKAAGKLPLTSGVTKAPIKKNAISIDPLGEFQRHPDIKEWFLRDDVRVSYFDGIALPFIVKDIEEDDSPEDFSAAVRQFLALSASDRAVAAPYVFEDYRLAVAVSDVECTIAFEADVWSHVHPTEVYVSRRYRHDNDVYIQIMADCDWEEEHGLQIVLRRGNTLSRVSSQDGHLATADAFDLPEERNTIRYENK